MAKKETVAVPVPDAEKKLKLDYNQTFRVGLAFATIMVFWTAYDFVVPLLLENAFGLSNMMRGLIMGLDNLLALFMLPLFGRLSDRSKGKIAKKFGRRTPFIVVGVLLAVSLMVFVPYSAQNQLEKSANIRAEYTSRLNDDAFMGETLEMFYGNPKYCDMILVNDKENGISKSDYVQIRYDGDLVSKSGFLGLGGTTYLYNGEEVALTDTVTDSNGRTRTVREILDGNKLYDRFVEDGMNTYISEKVEDIVLSSKAGVTSLSVYMVILLLVLIAMAIYRSPAVALMPDVTPKPLRSQANAIINLMGGAGSAIAFLIYTVVLFQTSIYNYTIIFGSVAAAMLVLLGLFLIFNKENKLVEKCRKTCEEYGITDEENEQAELEKLADEAVNNPLTSEAMTVGTMEQQKTKGKVHEFNAKIEAKFNAKYAHLTPEERKVKLEKAKKISFLLILASIFMWFMGYNSVSSNLSIYCVKALNLSPGVASIISGVSMGVSAIAFIPVGMLAVKIGRRKSIMIGFSLAVLSFVLIFTPLIKMTDIEVAKAALFAVFYLIAGFGLIIANVNTFPMVTELSTEATVGQYTGYYYAATMSAQAITPFIAGALMDKWGSNTLFIYAAICIVIAIGLMVFVRYGDSAQIPKGKKLSKDEKKQVVLEAMDSAD